MTLELTDREQKLLRTAISRSIWYELNQPARRSVTEKLISSKAVAEYEALKSRIAGI